MRFLFICAHERYLCENRTYRDILQHYAQHGKHPVNIVYTNQVLTEAAFDVYNPDLVVFFDIDCIRYGPKFMFALKKPVFACSLDYFHFSRVKKDPFTHRCRGIITFPRQPKIMLPYRSIFPRKAFLSFNGRFINTAIYRNHNQRKKYDIFIFGGRSNILPIEAHVADREYKIRWEKHHSSKLPDKYYFYPLRKRVEELLSKNRDRYNLKILGEWASINYGKGKKDGGYVNESLSRLINESWLALCCSSRADILMDKYIEVAGSYSAILGNIPSDYEHVFKNNIVEVTEWMTDEEILSTIDRALEDKQSLQIMTTRLGDRIHKEFDLSSATKNMDRVFDDMTKGGS